MSGLHLTAHERERLEALVGLMVDAQGLRRARAVLKNAGLLKSGPGVPSHKAQTPHPAAIADVISSCLAESVGQHGALSALATLARESWKTPNLEDRARQAFRRASSAMERGNWPAYEREVARLAEIAEDAPHPLIDECEALLGLATRKPDRLQIVLVEGLAPSVAEPQGAPSDARPAETRKSNTVVRRGQRVVRTGHSNSTKPGTESTSPAGRVVTRTLPGPPKVRAVSSPHPIVHLRVPEGTDRPKESREGDKPEQRASSASAPDDPANPVVPPTNEGADGTGSLHSWMATLRTLAEVSEIPSLSAKDLSPLWSPALESALDVVRRASDAEQLAEALEQVSSVALGCRQQVNGTVATTSERRAAARTELLRHLGAATLDEILGRCQSLIDDISEFDSIAEDIEAVVRKKCPNDGLAAALEAAEAHLATHREATQKQARILALEAELAALKGDSPALVVARPEVTTTPASTELAETRELAFTTARQRPTRFPHPDGYLGSLGSTTVTAPKAFFLPIDQSMAGPAPDGASALEAVNAAGGWIARTALQLIAPKGRSASLNTAVRLFRDLSCISDAGCSEEELDLLLTATVAGLTLSGSALTEARRRIEAERIAGCETRSALEISLVGVLEKLDDGAVLGFLFPKAAQAGLLDGLLRVGLRVDAQSRTAGRAWFDALGIALAVAPPVERERAWEEACSIAEIRSDQRQAIEQWFDAERHRPRKGPVAVPPFSAPSWFTDLVERLGHCDYESEPKGKASLGIRVPKLIGAEGIYLPSGQTWARAPLLVSNAGRRAAAGIEVTIEALTEGVTVSEGHGRLQLPWLGANSVLESWDSLIELPLEVTAESPPATIEIRWIATWAAESKGAQTSGTLKLSTTDVAPASREMNVPPECITGEPIDLHETEVLERSSSSVQECFKTLLTDLRRGRSVRAVVFGRRRRGKSSICRSLEQDRELQNRYVVKVSTWNSSRMTELRHAYEHLSALIASAVAVRNIVVKPIQLDELASRETLYAAWQEWLETLSKKTSETTRLLLLIDEFQRWIAGLLDVRDRRALLNVLRGFNDLPATGSLEVSFVLFGLQNLDRFRSESIDFAAAVQSFELKPFNQAEATRYVRQCLPHDHDERVRRRLHRLSGGNPFVLNLMCQKLIKAANEDERTWCAPRDVDEIMKGLDGRIESVFRYMLREDEEEEAPSLPQLTVLRAVASRLVELDDPSGSVGVTEVQEWLARRGIAFDEGLPAEQLTQLAEAGILTRHIDERRFGISGEAICRWLAANDGAAAALRPVTRNLDVSLVLNRYEQIEKLGEGGQATAWRAVNVEEGGHEVVLKIYPGTGDDVRQRIEREGKALEQIESQYVVRCLGYRVDERKGGVVVMERVDGVGLDQLLEKRPAGAQRILPGAALNDQVDLLSKLAEAVAAVHRAGVVHKDLKPANIMMLEEGGVWRPKIIDFGIAAPEAEDGASALTQSMWTWRYLAPEKRSDAKTSRRKPADIYSLGVVFLDLLVGPSETEPGTVLEDAALTAKMRALLSEMLDPEPSLRPSAGQVVGRLDGVLEPEGWNELREAADHRLVEEALPESALELYRRAVVEAPRGDQRSEGFAKMLGYVLLCAEEAKQPIPWLDTLFGAALEAHEHVEPEVWSGLFERAFDADRRLTGKPKTFAAILDVMDSEEFRWNAALAPLARALAMCRPPRDYGDRVFAILTTAYGQGFAEADPIATFCARQARWLRGESRPLPLVESWLRRGRRLLPDMNHELHEEQGEYQKLFKKSHSAAALPQDAERQDRKVIGTGERGHIDVTRVERFGIELLDSYPWIEAVKRVRGDSALPNTVPALLDESNIARHRIEGIPDERIIPFALDASFTRYDGCVRMNILLPSDTTAAQKAAAREVLASNRRLFP